MFNNTRKYTTESQSDQALVRDFKAFRGRVIYGSSEYYDIMFKKVFYSLRGYRSHPILFDIMTKGSENLYLGSQPVKVSLEMNKEV